MGLTQTHALGRNRQFYVETESTAGTFVKATGAGAAKVLKCSIGLTQERKHEIEARQSRSRYPRVTGKASVPWSVEANIRPSGTAGTPPDLHQLFFAALGTYANVGGTSDTYSPSATQTLRTVSLTHHYNAVLQESCWGAWVNAMTISVSGGDEAKVSFDGGAMGRAVTTPTTLNGAMSASATMVVDDGPAVAKGSVVKIDTDDNSGAGYEVTVGTVAATSVTLETTVTANDADAVVPFAPTETTAGNPIANIAGSLVIDSVTHPITAFDVTVANNIKPLDDEAFQSLPTDIIPGWRDVTGNLSFRARKDLLIKIGQREELLTLDFAITIGNSAGSICTINMNQVELQFQDVEIPEEEEAIVKLPFVALASTDTAEDEIDIVFT